MFLLSILLCIISIIVTILAFTVLCTVFDFADCMVGIIGFIVLMLISIVFLDGSQKSSTWKTIYSYEIPKSEITEILSKDELALQINWNKGAEFTFEKYKNVLTMKNGHYKMYLQQYKPVFNLFGYTFDYVVIFDGTGERTNDQQINTTKTY